MVIPITVLEEIDKFKKGNEIINFNAREFSRKLDGMGGDKLLNEGIRLAERRHASIVDTNVTPRRAAGGDLPRRQARSPHHLPRVQPGQGVRQGPRLPRVQGHQHPHEGQEPRDHGGRLRDGQDRQHRRAVQGQVHPGGRGRHAHRRAVPGRDGGAGQVRPGPRPVPQRVLHHQEPEQEHAGHVRRGGEGVQAHPEAARVRHRPAQRGADILPGRAVQREHSPGDHGGQGRHGKDPDGAGRRAGEALQLQADLPRPAHRAAVQQGHRVPPRRHQEQAGSRTCSRSSTTSR